MPEYGDILAFLAKHPPQQDCERRLHASLLELMAACLREERGASAALQTELVRSFDERSRAHDAGAPDTGGLRSAV